MSMSKVYLAVSGARDVLLGHVNDEGKVIRSQAGPDEEIGHIDLAKGDVYRRRTGPDEKVGHVDVKSGKVYTTRLGPDEYAGTVNQDGSMRKQVALGGDRYIGKVEPFVSYALSGAAMLLLVLPEVLDKDKDN
jgi:hypothetical protein